MSGDGPEQLFVARALPYDDDVLDLGRVDVTIPNPGGPHPPAPKGPWHGAYVRTDLHEQGLKDSQAAHDKSIAVTRKAYFAALDKIKELERERDEARNVARAETEMIEKQAARIEELEKRLATYKNPSTTPDAKPVDLHRCTGRDSTAVCPVHGWHCPR